MVKEDKKEKDCLKDCGVCIDEPCLICSVHETHKEREKDKILFDTNMYKLNNGVKISMGL